MVLQGYVPSASIVTDRQQLYIAMGILGATVMPHNLYLHTAAGAVPRSGRRPARPARGHPLRHLSTARSRCRCALLINSAILITAAATFHHRQTEVAEIQEAYQLMAPLLGSGLAATLFAVALLACGHQLDGHRHTRRAGGHGRLPALPASPPGCGALVTRLVAIVPVVIVTWIYGDSGTAQMLVLSQVVLSHAAALCRGAVMMFASATGRGSANSSRRAGWPWWPG